MTSLSGLNDGDFTNIDVVYTISINGNSGSNNQVLTSNGDTTEYKTIDGSMVTLEDLTADGTTLIGGSPTGIYDGSIARSISVAKVPNALTAGTNISFSSGTTYDGSAAITISSTDTDTQLNLTEGDGITITNTGGLNRTIKAKPDENTIDFTSGELEVQKVPNALTAGTNISFSVGSTYDGSAAITISSTDTDTTYAGGNNISINTATNPDEIDLDPAITGMTGITYSGGGGNNLTGGGGAGGETIATYLDLTSDTNLMPSLYPEQVKPYLVFDVYDPAMLDSDSLSTSYAQIFSGNLSNSFTAKTTAVEVSIQIFHAASTSNRWLYLRLSDGSGGEWSSGMGTGGGVGTGTRNTERLVSYPDETDNRVVNVSWYLQGLTIGNSYTINPYAKTNAIYAYIYAGGSFPACILKVINL